MRKQLFALGLGLSLSLPTTLFAKSNADLPLEEIRNFVDVYNAIRNEYVEEKEGKVLIDYAIEGMLNGLDPHSVYLKKSELEGFKDNTTGRYVGYGFELEIINGRLIIISPIPNSPAEAAGLKPNDHIIKIDDTVIDKMTMPEISQLLKEKEQVTLTIMRKGEDTQRVKLVKSTVSLPSVNHKIIDKQYGYIRVTQFQMDTASQFERALSSLMQEDVKGLVLDLRNNPGGLINAATNIADMFLDAGLIVSTKNENTDTEDKIHAHKATLAKELPLVVLINDGSASASELLAGALQSHKRAIVVGQRSFGKGSVQNIIPLDTGDAIKLTTARYYTPDGNSIQAEGITPDIVLKQLTVEDKEESPLSYGEANMHKHLDKGRAAADEQDDAEADDSESTEDEKNASEASPAKPAECDALDVDFDEGEMSEKELKDKMDAIEMLLEKCGKADEDDSQTQKQKVDTLDELVKSDLQLFEAINVLKVLIFKQ